MSFGHPSRSPLQQTVRLGAVIAIHVALAWGLMNGLARHVAQLIKVPIDARMIEEVKPPAPKVELPPPPKFVPPPAFVPPPEVSIQAPAVAAPTISSTTAVPVPPVTEPKPQPPAEVVAPKPVKVSAAVACSNYAKLMDEAGFPREALRRGLERGDALVQFTLGESGEVKDVKALQASHPIFAANSVRIVSEYRCTGQGREVMVQVPFSYQRE